MKLITFFFLSSISINSFAALQVRELMCNFYDSTSTTSVTNKAIHDPTVGPWEPLPLEIVGKSSVCKVDIDQYSGKTEISLLPKDDHRPYAHSRFTQLIQDNMKFELTGGNLDSCYCYYTKIKDIEI